MNHQVSEVAPCRKKIECTHDAAEVDAAFDAVYAELNEGAHVKGFRPGRVPRRMLENRFATPAAQDVASKLISSSLEKVMEDEKINPMSEPKIAPEKPVAQPGTAFTYTAEVDVRPTFDLAEYRGLEIEERLAPVGEADVDDRLARIRENLSDRPVVTDPAAPGDYLGVDVTVTAEGRELVNRTEQTVKVEGGNLFDLPCPDLVDKLTGAATGDTITFVQALPADHPEEALRGKEARTVLKVREVRRPNLPTLDDAWAQRMGLESIANLRAKVREALEREKAEERHHELERQIVDKLIAANPFALPAEVLKRQTSSRLMQQWMRLARMGVSDDFLRENADELQTKTAEDTERSMRWSIIADAIAEKEKVEIKPEEVQAHIDLLARQNQVTPAKVAQTIRQEPNGMYQIAAEIRDVKLMKILIDAAKVTTVAPEMSAEAKEREARQQK